MPGQVENCPRGYPNLAAFLDSDEGYMVYRRFGYIQSRLLLAKQDDLRILEHQLDRLDAAEEANRPSNCMTRDLRPADAAPREELLKKTEEKFREYGKLRRHRC